MTELLTDPGHTRSDLRQIESAIRKGWVIPDMVLDALPKTMAVIALKGKPRDQVAAAKVLLAMKGQNDEYEQPRQIEHHHTHDIGPVTADNLAEHKRRLLAELGQ